MLAELASPGWLASLWSSFLTAWLVGIALVLQVVAALLDAATGTGQVVSATLAFVAAAAASAALGLLLPRQAPGPKLAAAVPRARGSC